VVGQAATGFKSTTVNGPSGALIELADWTWGQGVLLWIIAIGLFAYGGFCIAEASPQGDIKHANSTVGGEL
jgi:hypothetical protein